MIAAARATAKSLANSFKPFPKSSFDLPAPRIQRQDDFGAVVEWPNGTPSPAVRNENEGTTTVITDVFRRGTPKGSAGQMIADALRLIGNESPASIRFAPIVEESTAAALRSGTDAAETLLGKTLQNTVEDLGGRIVSWSTGFTRGKPWIQVKLSY